MKFTKLLTSAVAIAALTFSTSGAKGIEDIKSESRILNNNFDNIIGGMTKECFDNDKLRITSDCDDYMLHKVFFGDTIMGVFEDLLESDDEVGFRDMLRIITDVWEIDINEIEDMMGYSFVKAMIHFNAEKSFMVLKNTKYDFAYSISDINSNKRFKDIYNSKR